MNFVSKLFLSVCILSLINSKVYASKECILSISNYNSYDLNYCIEVAKSGNVKVQHSLGLVYMQGANNNQLGIFNNKKLPLIEIDYVKSFFWFKEAANQNYSNSMLRLASYYSRGKGTLKDIDKSFYFINLAAQNDNINAKLILASIYAGKLPNKLINKLVFNNNNNKYQDPIELYNISTSLFDIGPDHIKSSNIYKQLLYEEKDINSKLSKFIISKLTELNFHKKLFYEHYIWSSILKAISKDFIPSTDINISKSNLTNEEVVIANNYIINFLEKGFPEYEMQEILEEEIIVIKEEKEKGSLNVTSTGSGFYINNNGQIITNNHVTKSCKKLSIAHLNKRIDGQIKVFDEDIDISIIETDKKNNSSAIFRKKDIELGENIMVVGFPLQGLLATSANVTTGIISATKGIQDNENFYQISAPIQSGNSGGAVLDEYGYVVGIVVSKLDSIKLMNLAGEIPQNVNFAIQKNKILTFLKNNNIKYETSNNLKKISTVLRAGKGKVMSVMIECWN